jgi:uncharacterized protein (TIGR02271 family)
MAKVVVGLYDRIEDARDAVEALVNSGFRREDISLVASDASGEYQKYTTADQGEDVADGAASGAGIGAVIGGLGGLLVGLGALAIPGIGPVLAAGPLVSALAGAGIGAAAGGLIGALVDLGIPEDQARVYSEGVQRGGSLVTLTASDDRAQEAVDIMNRFNPIDVNRRSQEWTSSGEYRGQDTAMDMGRDTGMDRSTMDMPAMDRDKDTLEVVEEEMRVGKREVEEGGVRVHTDVTERPVQETVDLRKEHVDVERRPVDRPASPEDLNTFEEGTIEVTARSEEPVVEKRARVVEEVEIRKDVEHQQETVSDTVRRKDVEVEPISAQTTRSGYTGDMGFDEYEPMFRNHYQTTYSGTGRTYDEFRPAYNYGYTLANDPRYRDRSWNEIEMDARRDWETRHADSPWEGVKDTIRDAWAAVTGRR